MVYYDKYFFNNILLELKLLTIENKNTNFRRPPPYGVKNNWKINVWINILLQWWTGQPYVHYVQALLDTVQSYQRDVDEVSDQAQALTKVSSEARVTTYVSQLTDRYNTLTNSVKVSDPSRTSNS